MQNHYNRDRRSRSNSPVQGPPVFYFQGQPPSPVLGPVPLHVQGPVFYDTNGVLCNGMIYYPPVHPVQEQMISQWEIQKQQLQQQEFEYYQSVELQIRQEEFKFQRDLEIKHQQDELSRQKDEDIKRQAEIKRQQDEIKRQRDEAFKQQEELKRQQEEIKRQEDEIKRQQDEFQKKQDKFFRKKNEEFQNSSYSINNIKDDRAIKKMLNLRDKDIKNNSQLNCDEKYDKISKSWEDLESYEKEFIRCYDEYIELCNEFQRKEKVFLDRRSYAGKAKHS